VSGVTPVAAAADVGDDSTVVVEVQLITCQLMECTLDDTSVQHPQYNPPKVLTRLFLSSSLLPPIRLGRDPLVQSRHSQEHRMIGHGAELSDPTAGGLVHFWTALPSSRQCQYDDHHIVADN
jgi:hypothetical protein